MHARIFAIKRSGSEIRSPEGSTNPGRGEGSIGSDNRPGMPTIEIRFPRGPKKKKKRETFGLCVGEEGGWLIALTRFPPHAISSPLKINESGKVMLYQSCPTRKEHRPRPSSSSSPYGRVSFFVFFLPALHRNLDSLAVIPPESWKASAQLPAVRAPRTDMCGLSYR